MDRGPNLIVLTHLTCQVRLMVVQSWEWKKMTERLTPVVSTSKVYTVISSFRQHVWSSKAQFKKHFSSQQYCTLMAAGDSKAVFQLRTARKNIFKKQSDIQESFANVSFGVIQACYIKVIFVIMAATILCTVRKNTGQHLLYLLRWCLTAATSNLLHCCCLLHSVNRRLCSLYSSTKRGGSNHCNRVKRRLLPSLMKADFTLTF